MIKLMKITGDKVTYLIDKNTVLTVKIGADARRILDFFNKIPANEK